MQYYFVVGTTGSYHHDVTWREINNYISNVSGIIGGLTDPPINMTIVERDTDRQRFVYHPEYTNVSYTSSNISVVTLNGEELEDGSDILQYEITYSSLNFYYELNDTELTVVRDALISTLAEIE